MYREKIFAKHISEFSKLDGKKKNQLENREKGMTHPLIQEDIQMADKHMKRQSKSSAIKMQNKTRREYW